MPGLFTYNVEERVQIGKTHVRTLVSRNGAHHANELWTRVTIGVKEERVLNDGKEILAVPKNDEVGAMRIVRSKTVVKKIWQCGVRKWRAGNRRRSSGVNGEECAITVSTGSRPFPTH